jgi:hypothetical protein
MLFIVPVDLKNNLCYNNNITSSNGESYDRNYSYQSTQPQES